MTEKLPERFAHLEPFAEIWALKTEIGRQKRRRASSNEEMTAFYEAMAPLMPDLLKKFDEFPLGDMPPEWFRLFDMAMSLAEVAPHVERFNGDTEIPYAYEEDRFVSAQANDRF